MTASLELEDRLRAGLQAAAETIPPAPDTIPAPGEPVVRSRPPAPTRLAGLRRRPAMVALAAAASLAAVVGTAVVLTQDDADSGDTGDVATASSAPSTTTSQPHQARTINGMVPGRATGDRDGTALHFYGPDGQETGTLDLGPMTNVQSAASDLEGGWVVCGMVYQPAPGETQGSPGAETGSTATTVPASAGDVQAALESERDSAAQLSGAADGDGTPTLDPGSITGGWVDRLTWFPADGAPVNLDIDGATPTCRENSVQVVDSADGPMALLGGIAFGISVPSARLDGIVLATGEHRELPVPDLPGLPDQWSVTTGLALTYIEGVGLQLYDLDTVEQVPTATIDPGRISDLALSHDGKTAAVLVGSIDGPDEAVVYDLATGAEVFRKSFDMSIEGDSMSYDGTTLAVGNYYDEHGPLTVIDLATGAEHTIAAGGVAL